MRMLRGVKVIPLGGVEEIGFNSTLIEFENTQILIDAGLGFPYGDLYGVDYVIPNVSYLKKSRNLKAILITHGHLDHIGGLPYILKDLDYPPIYCSKFAAELIKNNFERNNIDASRVKLVTINRDSVVNLGAFTVSYFGVNHSIPEAMGIIVKTPEGNIVHTGDFKFDNTPEFGNVAEYEKIALIGKEGVLALLSDSTNSFKSGHSMSEKAIYNNLYDIVKDAKGRVIVSTFSSLVSRIFQLIRIAEATNRKVLVLGRSMQNIIDIAFNLGYLKIDQRIFISQDKAKNLQGNRLLILATGAQGETMAALSRIVRNENRDIKIKRGDSVILSASVIPGNDILVQNLIDELSQMGAHVYHGADEMDLHTSGHGYQEDQKLMLNLVKPKFFMPVHGFQSFLYRHAQTAEDVGIKPENIVIAKRGDVISFSRDGFNRLGFVTANPVFVSGTGIGDVGTQILSERQQLANSGVLIVSVMINKVTNMLIEAPQVNCKGFVFIKENQELITSIRTSSEKVLNEELHMKSGEQKIRDRLLSLLKKTIYNKTHKDPLLVLLINYI
jgi:ribonuclease J